MQGPDTTIPERLGTELTMLATTVRGVLIALSEEDVTPRPAPGKWSRKEILGHLIDSAVNNLHRFVRAQQTAELVFPGYDQDAWVATQSHQTTPWAELVDLWCGLNLHVARAIRQVPVDTLGTPCRIGGGEAVTLGWLIEDYVRHLRHHLRQIGADV